MTDYQDTDPDERRLWLTMKVLQIFTMCDREAELEVTRWGYPVVNHGIILPEAVVGYREHHRLIESAYTLIADREYSYAQWFEVAYNVSNMNSAERARLLKKIEARNVL